MPVTIDILMSTYNGENFIKEQLDSIFDQSVTGWRLIIRDDASSDNTRQIIFDYQKKAPEKILLIDDENDQLGACQSFFRLMSHSTAQYIFFCDQDDVWLHNKMEMQIHAIREREASCTPGCPVLVHSDLKVVDEHLGLISSSLWKYQKIKPDSMRGLNRALVQNYVTGCTALINKPLLDYAKKEPLNSIMHDWWLLLTATIKGEVVTMAEATVLYRQHAENDTGAIRWSLLIALKKILIERVRLRDSLVKTRLQAQSLLNTGLLSKDQTATVKTYVAMYEKKYIIRRLEWLRMRFFKYGFLRNIAMSLLI